MNNINIDAKTLEMCLKAVNNIGSTTYMNICNGASNTVAWGGADWVVSLFFGLIIGMLALIVVGMIVTNIFRGY